MEAEGDAGRGCELEPIAVPEDQAERGRVLAQARADRFEHAAPVRETDAPHRSRLRGPPNAGCRLTGRSSGGARLVVRLVLRRPVIALVELPEHDPDGQRYGHGEDQPDDAEQIPAGEIAEDDQHGMEVGRLAQDQRPHHLIDRQPQQRGVDRVADDRPDAGRVLERHQPGQERRSRGADHRNQLENARQQGQQQGARQVEDQTEPDHRRRRSRTRRRTPSR
jgi:hypothetical protein